MRLGYACLNTTLPSSFRTCRLQTMRKEGMAKIKELTLHNFDEVLKILEWNKQHEIRFLRLSSDMVPFATHPEMDWKWHLDPDVIERTEKLKQAKQEYALRFSAHPGQYTVLNSPKEHVVQNAINDLHYHNTLLELVSGEDIIIHTGGAYGDKEKAKRTFAKTYKKLPNEIQQKLRLENDDRTFHTGDVLDINKLCGVTVCFDIHHERCFHTEEAELKELVDQVFKTWESLPKVHISSGKNNDFDPRHADLIRLEDFLMLKRVVGDREIDVMIEAKAKEKAVLDLREKLLKVGEL